MPSLAHEGNPKEDEIIITAGDVLSTAQLDIDFQFFGGAPNIPPTADPDLTVISSTCSDVFEWAGENDNDTFQGSASGRDWLYLLQTPASGNSLERYNDQTLHLRINSTEHCYGALWQSFYPLHFNNVSATAGQTIDWRVTFNGVIDGVPRAGPAVWLLDGTTHDNATLYAAIVNMEASALWICKWASQSLGTLTVPLFTMVLPNIGDRIEISMVQEAVSAGFGSNGIFVNIYDSSDNLREGSESLFDDINNSAESQVRHTKMNVGFVSIGGVQGGKLEFKTRIGSYLEDTTTPFLLSINPS